MVQKLTAFQAYSGEFKSSNQLYPKCNQFPLLAQIDDQICLLINSWCELLLFSCCFRSISTPGEVRISLGKSINLEQAKSSGLQVNIDEYS